jgi:hypothetical protein
MRKLLKIATSFSPVSCRPNPYPSIDAIKEALAELGEKDPKARAARPEEFADMSIIAELDRSGFIDGLDKTKR